MEHRKEYKELKRKLQKELRKKDLELHHCELQFEKQDLEEDDWKQDDHLGLHFKQDQVVDQHHLEVEKQELELELYHCKQQLKKQDLELHCCKLQLENQELELDCRKMQLEKQQLELDRRELQLEKQANQIQAQEDKLSELMLIIEDAEKDIATLVPGSPQQSGIKFEHGHPEEKGPCYWIFHKYQHAVANAIKVSVAEVAHQLSKHNLVTPRMEKYMTENTTTPSDDKADELVEAVQVTLDGNPDNFRKVIMVLKNSESPSCKKMGDRLEYEYSLSNANSYLLPC